MRFVRLHIKGSVRRLFVGCGLYEHEQDGTVIRSHLEGSRTAFVQGAENKRSNRPLVRWQVALCIPHSVRVLGVLGVPVVPVVHAVLVLRL